MYLTVIDKDVEIKAESPPNKHILPIVRAMASLQRGSFGFFSKSLRPMFGRTVVWIRRDSLVYR